MPNQNQKKEKGNKANKQDEDSDIPPTKMEPGGWATLSLKKLGVALWKVTILAIRVVVNFLSFQLLRLATLNRMYFPFEINDSTRRRRME